MPDDDDLTGALTRVITEMINSRMDIPSTTTLHAPPLPSRGTISPDWFKVVRPPRGAHRRQKPRQYRHMRIIGFAVAMLLFFALGSALTEIGLHGFGFFTFRSQGVGETPATGLNEAQGPGQPDAPGSKVTCAMNSGGTCAGPVLPRVTVPVHSQSHRWGKRKDATWLPYS